MTIPLDIINELQFFLGNNYDNKKLQYAFPKDYKNIIKYNFDFINYDYVTKNQHLILKLTITSNNYNLDKFINLVSLKYEFPNRGELKVVPKLPDSVRILDCSYNDNLTIFPELSNITHLYCSFNYSLRSLPDLPKVILLNCINSGLTSLPEELPNATTVLISHNYFIKLPKMPNVKELCCELGVIPKKDFPNVCLVCLKGQHCLRPHDTNVHIFQCIV
jgi:hypothetical protein